MVFTGNLKDNFRNFKQESYLSAATISNFTEEVKCATLLPEIGPGGVI